MDCGRYERNKSPPPEPGTPSLLCSCDGYKVEGLDRTRGRGKCVSEGGLVTSETTPVTMPVTKLVASLSYSEIRRGKEATKFRKARENPPKSRSPAVRGVKSMSMTTKHAGERTRTSTGFPPPEPKSGASANSATPAHENGDRIINGADPSGNLTLQIGSRAGGSP